MGLEGTAAGGLTAISIAPAIEVQSPEGEAAAIDVLAPHVVRAFHLQRRLHGMTFVSAALANALDVVVYGVVLIDERERIVLANRAARDIAAREHGLRFTAGGLSASTPADRIKLKEAIATSLSRGIGNSLSLARADDPPLLVTIVPLARDTTLSLRARAAVFITDSVGRRAVHAQTLRSLFGLTNAECRVADSLVETHRLAGTAASLGVSFETGRSHLKRIFAKTGTSRVSEFVRLYERLGAVRSVLDTP